MATDFSEKERAFIDALKSETGRDLCGWMDAIGASGSTQRNDIIDWLRQQGFTFARASWLERIHHNGGRLIYLGGEERVPGSVRRTAVAVGKAAPPPRGCEALASDQAVEALMAGARAYRPLAQAVLRDLLAAVPGADAAAHAGYIVVGQPRTFAALLPSPRDVRLLLALGPNSEPEGWQRIKSHPAAMEIVAHLTHMVVLTDARQLTAALRDLVMTSARASRG